MFVWWVMMPFVCLVVYVMLLIVLLWRINSILDLVVAYFLGIHLVRKDDGFMILKRVNFLWAGMSFFQGFSSPILLFFLMWHKSNGIYIFPNHLFGRMIGDGAPFGVDGTGMSIGDVDTPPRPTRSIVGDASPTHVRIGEVMCTSTSLDLRGNSSSFGVWTSH